MKNLSEQALITVNFTVWAVVAIMVVFRAASCQEHKDSTKSRTECSPGSSNAVTAKRRHE